MSHQTKKESTNMEADLRVPKKVYARARWMVLKYIVSNPNWKNHEGEYDEWYGTNDYDLNLVVNDDVISVVAYPVGDTSKWQHLIIKG